MANNRVAFFTLFFILLFQSSIPAALTTKKQSPGFQEIQKWLGAPLEKANGKVLLVSFWNPSNTTSLWEIPVLSHWYERYKASSPFEIILVAVPEFQFEKDTSKTEPVINKLKVPFPVALDPDQKLWKAYGVQTLPSHFLIDTNGFIRNSFTGEINYSTLEDAIQILLKEENANLPIIEKTNIPELNHFPSLYFGYKTLSGYGGNEKLQAERSIAFNYPENTSPFHFYLSGRWVPMEENLRTAPPLSSVKILFDSSVASLVAGTEKRSLVPAEVRLDGAPLSKENKGKDIVLQEGKSYVFIREYRLYKLLKNKMGSGSHSLELIFEEPGIEIFKASFE